MQPMTNKILSAGRIVQQGRSYALLDLLKERWSADHICLGLRRDLTMPIEIFRAGIPLVIRPLKTHDANLLLDLTTPSITNAEREERMTRLQMVEAGIKTCYVAVGSDDIPRYMAWLIEPHENKKVQAYFKGLYPLLAPGEVLLEGAYAPEQYRGQGIMTHVSCHLLEIAAQKGARFAIRFCGIGNLPALRNGKRVGFAPYLVRVERWRYFRRQVIFRPLHVETASPLEKWLGEALHVASDKRTDNTRIGE